MTRTPTLLPPELVGTFTALDARRLGVNKDRLTRGDLEQPFYGLHRRRLEIPPSRSAHPEPEWVLRHRVDARALMPFLPDDAFICGRSAAILWGLPLPIPRQGEAPPPIEVGRFAPKRVTRHRGVRGVQMQPGKVDVVRRGTLRLTSPASTWAMLGQELDLRDLVALGDAVVRRARIPGTQRLERRPLGTIEQLRGELVRGRRRGLVLLREAVEVVRTGSASPPETHLRLALSDAGLPEPELDIDVYDPAGRLIGCSEIGYPEFKVAGEYESEHHRVEREQWNRDIQKYRDYEDAGWSVIRATSHLLYRRAPVLVGQFHRALRRAGWSP